MWKKEALYFLIPESDLDKSLKVSFVDTWHMERNYGGKRVHEGTDIMAVENKRGLYPVVSVSDGTVKKRKAGLKKGGWRIGIISDSSTYYYHASSDSYTKPESRRLCKSRENCLGMAETAVMEAEGTVGQFPHIYILEFIFMKMGKKSALILYEVLIFL